MFALLTIFIIILGLYLIISGLREDIRIEPLKEYEGKGEYGRDELRESEEINRILEKKTDKKRKVSGSGGGVILIGPIPIVFGDSKYAAISLVLAIILMLISISLILFI